MVGDTDILSTIAMKKSLLQRRVPRKIGRDDDDEDAGSGSATGEFSLWLHFEIWPASDALSLKQLADSGD